MTAQVSIECTRCGSSRPVPVDALLVVPVDVDDHPHDPELAARVSWVCQQCADLVDIPVDWTGLLVLVTEGAALLSSDEDDDEPLPPHPETPAAGPTFTADDLLELHELLAADSWFDGFAARSTPQ